MRKLPRPPLKAQGVFGVCALSVQSIELKTRLFGAISEVTSAEQQYATLAPVASLHQFPAKDHVGDWVMGEEMETLYTGTLARLESTARPYYDAIPASAPNDICPYCGQRTVDSLDHYLPKSLYPALAVTPINLVPACSACNKTKLDFQPTDAKELILHPYYDDAPKDIWLKARVLDVGGRPVLEYFADPPSTWPTLWASRVGAHLDTLKLPTLYALHAAEELVNNRQSLQKLHHSGGAAEVKAHCREVQDSRQAAYLNSWQAACYGALVDSDWFCASGVLAIEASKPVWPIDPSEKIDALVMGQIAAL
ncbi:5-methylcytosine-specific restriction endonuclease McrA [Acidovorax delafieldii]|uniref:HNH endonuclease n=1 Tax=Acidovorax delafieldii TaxID=47920 RepID=UPI002854B669|nr:HNH endonuclease [Acidovorax delafieldii]MDR6155553.1 5-methylcytosine-specific restriction endonuclease McrA [Acidovorax delafieldii]